MNYAGRSDLLKERMCWLQGGLILKYFLI